jgi:hypothetical protein
MWRFKIFLPLMDSGYTSVPSEFYKNNAARLFEIAWQSIGVSNNGNSKIAKAEGKNSALQKKW